MCFDINMYAAHRIILFIAHLIYMSVSVMLTLVVTGSNAEFPETVQGKCSGTFAQESVQYRQNGPFSSGGQK